MHDADRLSLLPCGHCGDRGLGFTPDADGPRLEKTGRHRRPANSAPDPQPVPTPASLLPADDAGFAVASPSTRRATPHHPERHPNPPAGQPGISTAS